MFDDRLQSQKRLTLDAILSSGIRDLLDERAGVVRRLNEVRVPVIAWLLPPEEDGYWLNIDNVEQSLNLDMRFKAWTTANGYEWAGVGLDIEIDF